MLAFDKVLGKQMPTRMKMVPPVPPASHEQIEKQILWQNLHTSKYAWIDRVGFVSIL